MNITEAKAALRELKKNPPASSPAALRKYERDLLRILAALEPHRPAFNKYRKNMDLVADAAEPVLPCLGVPGFATLVGFLDPDGPRFQSIIDIYWGALLLSENKEQIFKDLIQALQNDEDAPRDDERQEKLGDFYYQKTDKSLDV